MRIPFGIESYRLRSLPLSAQRLVNCYIEPAPPQAKTQAAVIASYGITDFADEDIDGVTRGGIIRNGIPYAVIGTLLYQVSESGGLATLGTIPGVDRVDMACDEASIMIVTGSTDYYYMAGTVQAITDPDYPGADWVENLDGYYIVSRNGQFYVSANRDPSSWDALDFASAEKSPDDILDGIKDHSELILFGRDSGEVWYDSGDADFPLAKVNSGDFEVGIYCQRAKCRADNGVFFVGHDGFVYRLNGYTPQRVSTYAVEQAIEDATDKSIRCITWKEAGHEFVAVTTTQYTFVYDCSTQLWHERNSYGYAYWRAEFVLRCFDKFLVGDSLTGRIGQLDPDTFTEWDGILRCSATSPPVSQDNARLVHDRIELVFEQGVGLITGQGSDPQIMLRWSDDGGRTWSNEKWRPLGAIGAFRTRAIWNRAGMSRDRVFEYSITDPVRRTLILATDEVTVRGN